MMQRKAYFEVKDDNGQLVMVRLSDHHQIREAIRRGVRKVSRKEARRRRKQHG